MESLDDQGGATSPNYGSNNSAYGGDGSHSNVGGGGGQIMMADDLDMADLNDSALSESLDAFLAYGEDDDETQNAEPQPIQPQQTLVQVGGTTTLGGGNVTSGSTTTVAMAPPPAPQQPVNNNMFAFPAQMSLAAAAAAAAALPTNPFLAALVGAAAAATTPSVASLPVAPATSTAMPAPPPVPVASTNRTVGSTAAAPMAAPLATKAATVCTGAPASASAPASALPVPTLFGKAISLPHVSAPSKPLQLSPWEIEQAKRKGARSSSSSSIAASAPASMAPPPMSMVQVHHNFPAATATTKPRAKKRPRNTTTGDGSSSISTAVSEDETDREKRRQDRNQREQNRSQQITHQIDHLRNVLAAANVQFKPDKYSTLASVVEYIKELQEKSSGLDEEHSKLLQTITDTTEIMNNRYLPAQTNGTDAPVLKPSSSSTSSIQQGGGVVVSSCDEASTAASTSDGVVVVAPPDPTLSLLQGVDFKFIFQRCPVASAVTSIDGRFLDCNEQFEQACGFARPELLVASEKAPQQQENNSTTTSQAAGAAAAATKNLSLFNILQQSDMERVYTAMSHMLQRPMFMTGNDDSGKSDSSTTTDDMWAEKVTLCRMDKAEVRLTLSLVRSDHEGRPRFFNCVLIPKDEDAD